MTGDVLVVIPDNEISYGCANNNYYYIESGLCDELGKYPNDSIYSIECTHTMDDGSMSLATRLTLVERLADLCIKYDLSPLEDIILHYNITGKNCHKYFVDNENEFIELKEQVDELMEIKLRDNTEQWKIDLAIDSINNLFEKGFINNPSEHIDNLKNDTIEPYVFWVMIDRLSK